MMKPMAQGSVHIAGHESQPRNLVQRPHLGDEKCQILPIADTLMYCLY